MFRTYIYQDDGAARELGKLVEKHKLDWVPLRSPDEIDCGDRFIVLNSSNGKHHRTLAALKKCTQIDGCFLIDEHDDITLGNMTFENPGQGNWVEHVLKLNLCKVVFVGQHYWAHKLIFRGSNYSGLLRTNLHRYKLDSIYFVCFLERNTLVYCDKKTFSRITPKLKNIQDIETIEKIYVLDEEIANIEDKLKKVKINVFSRDELIWETSKMFEYLYPVFLIKWRKTKISDLPLKNVYISIDLDVLLDLSKICSAIKEIGRNFNIVAADIYGNGVDWLKKTNAIYEVLTNLLI